MKELIIWKEVPVLSVFINDMKMLSNEVITTANSIKSCKFPASLSTSEWFNQTWYVGNVVGIHDGAYGWTLERALKGTRIGNSSDYSVLTLVTNPS